MLPITASKLASGPLAMPLSVSRVLPPHMGVQQMETVYLGVIHLESADGASDRANAGLWSSDHSSFPSSSIHCT